MSAGAFDVIVIGGGPGGYVAAIRAAQLGFKTAVVERDNLGGICLNWGCIPTKALLRSAEVYHLMQNAADFGLSAEKIGFDIEAIVQRSRKVSSRLTGGIGMLMKKHKITVIEGSAALDRGKDAPTVVVGKDRYTAKHVILATGARARTIPQAGLEPDGDKIWTYREAMVPTEMPKSLLVIGSGAIGIEFASFYRTMGAEVTVVEMMDRVLPVEDEEISAFAAKSFKKQGLKLKVSAQVEKLEKTAKTVKVHVKDAKGKVEIVEVEKVIMAVGIAANIENMGLEALGVKIDRGHVVNDGFGRTNVKGLYAIGDVAGPPWLAHKASHEGVVCIEKIAGENVHAFETGNIPGCTYCHPQIASVGLTEAKAKAAGHEIKVGRFPFVGNGKAIALGDDQGLVKTVFDAKTGELLGAHMVGPEVTEMIQGYVVGRQLETTEAELMHTVFPHPTLSEMMHESVLDAYGRALHI
ncbi:dihydrolipoyl dehydrogenase [Maricaulis maris]|jgi:dihydrolipoamide dehydrogenase|uniref:Dihydrolipoyl dehydrogenase n=1 Tax=Maricaulis maris (strain MCS10) TaxID=394221 RepID=Q0APS0_MARMM|nr:dihydrolipoyl dehydrogenase [Maricaulis maris]ABI65717.1 dihydrolipoamide dehydrogenase [Maricaulis maris MCS10]